MNTSEIQKRIYDLVESLDNICSLWASAKADKNYSDEMKKVVLNVSKSASEEKTAAGKEQEAYCSESYKKYLWKAFKVDGEFYELDARKSKLEKELDAMRSLLSYEKSMTNATT